MGTSTLVAGDDRAPVVRVNALSKRYGRVEAVRGVTLEVLPGEIYGLIGPDGAGKSTLLKSIAGVLAFDGGSLDVFGETIDSEASAERVKPRLGFMPQGLGLGVYPELSVAENVEFFAELGGVGQRAFAERARELLSMTRLLPFGARLAKHLSGGMQQKLGLVCALIHAPELVILDEPTTGIDPISRRDFWAVLNDLVHASGVTALVSTSYLDEASRFDRLSLLFEGRELAQGTPVELAKAAPRAEGGLEDAFVALLSAPSKGDRGGVNRVVSFAAAPSSAAPTRARSTEAVIDASELTRDFGRFRAVDRVSFRVLPGELYGLLGANGAGKTTIIKLLTGILRPSSGTGRVAGVDMRRPGIAIKSRIGYVSQAFSLYTDLSVAENMRFYAGVYGLTRAESRARAAWVAEVAELGAFLEQRAGSAPPGVRQRLALGCALLHRPHVLFLDEPTSGVDPLGRKAFWSILARLAREEGVAALVTTHHMAEAEHCDRVALMFAGRLIADGPPAALKLDLERDAGRLLEITTDAPKAALACVERVGLGGAALFGRAVRAFSRDPGADIERVRSALANVGTSLQAVREIPASMEDVFVFRIGALERPESAKGDAA